MKSESFFFFQAALFSSLGASQLVPSAPTVLGMEWHPASTNRRARLNVVKQGRVLERVIVGAKSHYVLGRQESEVDIALLHESISRRHAVIGHRESGELCVTDLGSANGTFVDGARLAPSAEPTVLREGSSLTFGHSTRAYVVANLGAAKSSAMAPPASKRSSAAAAALQAQFPSSFGMAPVVEERSLVPPLPRGGLTRAEREAQIAAAVSSLAAAPAVRAPPPSSSSASSSSSAGSSSSRSASNTSTSTSTRSSSESASEDRDRAARKRKTPAASTSASATASDGAPDWSGEPQHIIEAMRLPVSNEVQLAGHTRVVSAVAWDRSGARMATGAHDGLVKLWEWSGMHRVHKPFRSFTALEEHAVVALSYSPSGAYIAAATGSAQLTVFNRDGAGGRHGGPLITGRKGDPYLHDMSKTVGHTTGIADLHWHPTDDNVVLTCADDSTLRLWKLDGKMKFDQLCCNSVLKVVTQKGHRTKVGACGWSTPGSRAAGAIIAAAEDGALHFWKPNRTANTRPNMTVWGAHRPASETAGNCTSAVCFAPSGSTVFASRGADGTVKLWDLRRFKKPMRVWSDLPNHHLTTALAWSPDGAIVATGTSGVSRSIAARIAAESSASSSSSSSSEAAQSLASVGTLTFCSAKLGGSGEGTPPPLQLPIVTGGSIVGLCWHSNTNQIALGCSDGVTRVLYDPRWSKKGALLSSSREQRKSSEDAAVAAQSALLRGQIYNPHALKSLQQHGEGGPNRKMQKTMARNDPIKSKKPSFPETGPQNPSHAPKGHQTTQFILKHIQRATYVSLSLSLYTTALLFGLAPRSPSPPSFSHLSSPLLVHTTHSYLDNDPRAALLKFAREDDGKEGRVPQFCAAGQIFTEKTLEQEHEDRQREVEKT
tara:strand:+ start:70 stop:2727 length:2658 start_codon:yes stop_codon:yes gene_type:complete